MGLTMSERRSLTEEVVRRYRRAGKKEKGVILGEFVKSSGYQRKYAIHLLNSWGRARWVRIDGKLVKLVVGRPRRAKRRLRPRRYDQEVLSVLKKIWYVFDCMCGKRLVVVLRTMLPVLESFGEIRLTCGVREARRGRQRLRSWSAVNNFAAWGPRVLSGVLFMSISCPSGTHSKSRIELRQVETIFWLSFVPLEGTCYISSIIVAPAWTSTCVVTGKGGPHHPCLPCLREPC